MKLQNLDNSSLENKNKEIEQYQFEITNQKKVKDISSSKGVFI